MNVNVPREGRGDAAGEVSDPEEVQFAPPPLPPFPAPDKAGEQQTHNRWMVPRLSHFRSRTQTALPG